MALTDNYKKLPTLNIYHHELNIIFSPKELFLEKGDKIFFFIAYSTHDYEGEWHIGNIFLEVILNGMEYLQAITNGYHLIVYEITYVAKKL